MDARTSRYHDIYAHWQRSPEVFWAEAAADDRLVREAEEGFRQGRRHLRPLVHGRDLQHLLQRARSSRACRAQRPAGADLRFSRHQYREDLHLRPDAVRGADYSAPCCATSASKKATASSSTCRWCRRRCSPCLPARASAQSIPWCSAALPPRNWPPASTTAKPKVILSASCGIEGARVIPYKPLLDEAIKLAQAQAAGLHDPAAPAMRGAVDGRPRPRLAQGVGERGQLRQDQRMRAGRCHRSALHPLHIRHDRHSKRRGARQWRPHGRAEMVDAESLRHIARRSVVVAAPTSAGWSAIPTSSMRRCSTAARRSSTKASRSARPTPARSGA